MTGPERPLVQLDLELVGGRDRRCRLARPLERAGDDVGDVVVGEVHLYAAGGTSFADHADALQRLLDDADQAAALFNLQTVYGDPRYRPSPWLRRRGALGLSLMHEEE